MHTLGSRSPWLRGVTSGGRMIRGLCLRPVHLAVCFVAVLVLTSGAIADHENPTAPNDPLFAPSPPARGVGQWGARQIRAEEAWHTSTGAGAVIAIVDTGVDLSHPDLSGKLLAGETFLGCGPDGCGNGDWKSGPPVLATAANANPHGTHVAGIAAAATGNGIGIAGIARDAMILPVKVLDSEGGYLTDIARGIRWAAENGADVINLSLGTLFGGLLPGSQVLTLAGAPNDVNDAIAYAHSKGAVVVAAAGNELFPLCDDLAFGSGALCVTATDSHELRADYSNLPINEALLAVAAPGGGLVDYVLSCGGGILSTVPPGTGATFCGYPGDAAYDEDLGTSMAAPHVSGVAALIAAMGCNRDQIIDALTSTARQPFAPGPVRGVFTPTYGFGIVDAAAAVAAASCP